MVDYHIPRNYTPFSVKAAHLRDPASYVNGDESVLSADTLSVHSDFDSSSDMTSLLMTTRSTSPTSLLGESGFHISIGDNDPVETVNFETWMKHTDTDLVRYDTTPLKLGKSDTPTTFAMEQDSGRFMPINTKIVISPRSRTPSPGMTKMLLSLSDHHVERPCSPNASSLYKNTKTHCNPSELGQQTYNECMMFTRWANMYLQHSLDQFLITDLARDLGDGITLLSLVEMLVGEYPPQIHIKPALDVQKMENIQTCLDFLEHYGVSINGVTADDIVKGNLKVILALCHSLQRHFGSSAVGIHQVEHQVDKDHFSLFNWVSKVTGKQVVDLQSFQDGTVLCLLLNKILDGVIPDLVLEFGSATEKISLALKVSSEQLNIGTGLRADSIMNQKGEEKFMDYLKSLHQVYSTKPKKAYDALEQRNVRRELKRQQLRDLRLKSERLGSELTYLGEQSQNKSRIAQEKFQVSLANASRGVPGNAEILERTAWQIDDLGHIPLTSGSTKMSSDGTVTDTKRQLDELRKELDLLKLECSDSRDENDYQSFTTPNSLFQGSSMQESKLLSALGKPKNPRQELRELHRGSTNANMSEESKKTIHSGDMLLALRQKTFETTSDDDQPRFGGCYLGNISSSFDDTRRRGPDRSRDELSFTFKEMDELPRSCVHGEIRTCLPHDSSVVSVFHSKSDTVGGSDLLHRKPYATETKGISNLFEVDFDDVDNKKNQGRENSALRRMLRAGDLSKLESGKLRPDLCSTHPTSDGKTRVNDGAKTTSPTSSFTRDKRERLYGSLGALHSRKPMYNEEKLYVRDKTSTGAPTRDSSEEHRQLHRSPSKEKRYREEVLAKKSARSVGPSQSTKTNLHALTTLIRMSAKNAGAMFGEEAH